MVRKNDILKLSIFKIGEDFIAHELDRDEARAKLRKFGATGDQVRDFIESFSKLRPLKRPYAYQVIASCSVGLAGSVRLIKQTKGLKRDHVGKYLVHENSGSGWRSGYPFADYYNTLKEANEAYESRVQFFESAWSDRVECRSNLESSTNSTIATSYKMVAETLSKMVA